MIHVIRWILLPFSFIYQFIVWIRNLFYDLNIFKSQSFDIPTIVVGNLTVGGTGKSPMTEHLIKLLSTDYKVATLSRGYGRKTTGFREVSPDSTAPEVGDEPLQFKRKFPHITVAVSEDRRAGVQKLQGKHDLIILDDAYQHRKLNPGFSILLFDYASFHKPRLTLPTGDFRDNFSSIKRADMVVITKCPDHLNVKQKQAIERKIRKYTAVPLFYTQIGYGRPINAQQDPLLSDLNDKDIILFCGIAKPQPLVSYLEQKNNRVHALIFPDHHPFTKKDYEQIITTYEKLPGKDKIIITTEKDFQRIQLTFFKDLPLFYIPIHLVSLNLPQDVLDSPVLNYISHQRNVNKP